MIGFSQLLGARSRANPQSLIGVMFSSAIDHWLLT